MNDIKFCPTVSGIKHLPVFPHYCHIDTFFFTEKSMCVFSSSSFLFSFCCLLQGSRCTGHKWHQLNRFVLPCPAYLLLWISVFIILSCLFLWYWCQMGILYQLRHKIRFILKYCNTWNMQWPFWKLFSLYFNHNHQNCHNSVRKCHTDIKFWTGPEQIRMDPNGT